MVRHFAIATAVMVSAAVIGGCQETKDKTQSAMTFIEGNVGTEIQKSPEEVMTAVHAAAGDLHLIVIATATTQADSKDVQSLVARTASDKKVTILVIAESATACRVSVNTGWFGDSTLRNQVMDTIKSHLGLTATTQATTQAMHG